MRKFVVGAAIAVLFGVACQSGGDAGDGGQAGGAGGGAAPDAKVERGRYLVNHVALCFYCHSDVDWNQAGFPVVAGHEGGGSVPFLEKSLAFLNAPNITPDAETGIGAWSDAEIARAVRQGVTRDGRQLFPAMPYLLYASMSDDDVAAVIAYLRSVPPVRRQIPLSSYPPPIKEMLASMPPLPAQAVAAPDPSDRIAYGGYLATIGLCTDCHTPRNQQGTPLMELAFAGGGRLEGPWGDIYSPNITPHPSGMPHYDEATFLRMIRTGNPGGKPLNAIMPWGYYRGMTDADLAAILAWMKTLPPMSHRIDNTSDPSACSVCSGVHGLGDMN